MSEGEAEKTTRTVVCDKHGLRYDPRLTAGCVRCRQEAAALAGADQAGERSGPSVLVFLLFGAALAVVVVMVMDPGLGESTEVPAATSTLATSDRATSDGATASAGPATTGTSEASATTASSAGSQLRTSDGFALHTGRSVTIVDPPEEEPFLVSGKSAPDVERIRFSTQGSVLLAEVEFWEHVRVYAEDFATGIGVVALFFDLDNDESTGGKGFAGRTGFEVELEGYVGVSYDGTDYVWAGGRTDSPIRDYSCSHRISAMVPTVSRLPFYEPWEDLPRSNTACSGRTMRLRVPFSTLGLTSGQTIRIATEEKMGSGKVPQYFLDDARLTL